MLQQVLLLAIYSW